MMTQAPFSAFDGFIETGFEQRFQGLLRQAWRQRSWHVVVAEPGSGKSMGIRDLVLTSTQSRGTMSGRSLPVLAVTAPKNDPKEQALGDYLMQAMSLPTRGRWREQQHTLLYVLRNYGVDCVIIDDAHDLSMQHLIFLKEITDQLLLPPYNHALGLWLVTAGRGATVPLKDIFDQPETMWMQFRRRLDRVQPYCQIANHTREEVRAILGTLEQVYQAYFPLLHLQKWTGAIYTWLTNPLLDLQDSKRVNMDHLMKVVTTALEWTYAEAKMDVTDQTLEAAAQLLMVQHKSVHVIDAPGAKESQTTPKKETPTDPPVPRPKRRRRAEASPPETSSELPVSDEPSTKGDQIASKEETPTDPPVPRPKRRRRAETSPPETSSRADVQVNEGRFGKGSSQLRFIQTFETQTGYGLVSPQKREEVMKKEARRSAHVNWTEIFGAIIVAIVGPLVVLITRKYWQDLQADQKYILTYGKEVAIRACSGNYVMADVNDQIYSLHVKGMGSHGKFLKSEILI